MNKEKCIESVLTQIEDRDVVREKPSILSVKQEKTCNGFDIYRDEATGEALGIVWGDFVILKKTSEEKLDWHDAEAYCQTVVVNGIVSELFPILPTEKEGPSEETKAPAAALAEIGAVNLDSPTWCQSYNGPAPEIYAWYLQFGARLSNGCKFDYRFFVRPVLRLKK